MNGPLNIKLKDYTCYIDDPTITLGYLRLSNIPSILTSGKNSIFIAGSEYLRSNSSILIQVLDIDGNDIPYQIQDGLMNGVDRVVTILVPSQNIKYGIGNITILAELNNVPTEWKGKYNIKWSFDILINPTIENSQKTIFYTSPIIEHSEIYDENRLISNKKYDVVTIEREVLTDTDPMLMMISANFKSEYYSTKREKRYLLSMLDMAYPPYYRFTKDMIGGTISISSSSLSWGWFEFELEPVNYSTTILDVLSPEYVVVDTPLFTKRIGTDIPIVEEIYGLNGSITYVSQSVINRPNTRNSYIKLDLKNIKTISGKLKYVDLYKNPSDVFLGRFEVIPEPILTNIFIDSGSFNDRFVLDGYTTSSIPTNNISNTKPIKIETYYASGV